MVQKLLFVVHAGVRIKMLTLELLQTERIFLVKRMFPNYKSTALIQKK